MDLDGYDPADADLDDGERTVVDEWVLSRLQSVEAEAREALDEFRVSDGLNTVLEFLTEDVSRFYVKAIRERMWEEADSDSKRGAYATLATVLDESIRLLAPFTPYLTERMYQLLDGEAASVHALSYPEADDDLRDEDLERRMSVLRDVEEAAANARQQGGRKLRWPVRRVVVASDDDAVADGIESLSELLADRVNARSVEVVSEFDELVERAVPEMSVIGPEFGADAQKVMDEVEGKTRAELEGGIEVDGETYELTEEMVSYEAEPPEHVSAASFDGGTVYVDTSLTDDIEAEGYARDVVRRVQEMRKRLDLDVESEIDTAVDVADDRVADFVDRHREYVATETRTREFVDGTPADGEWELIEEWDVEGVAVTIGVDPVEA